MTKTLCELKKALKGDLREFVRLVECPTHVCRKCGRVANDKERLCKPVKISSLK